MNSSGIKRGLATTAIAALAITGVPAIANAEPLTADLTAGAVQLIQPTNISTNNDGQNTTYRLTALAGTSVTRVTFEYSLNGGASYTTIGSTGRNDDGAFGLEWNASGIAGAPAVTLRATGNVSGDLDFDTSTAVAANNNLATTNITDGSALGVFQSPYVEGDTGDNVIVSGTSSLEDGKPALSYFNDNAFVAGGTAESTTEGANPTSGTWSGVLDLDAYDFTATNNQLLVQAVEPVTQPTDPEAPAVPLASDDTEAFTLYRQTITTVTAETTDAGANSSEVTVTVLDQNGAPIAGARVFPSNEAVADSVESNVTDENGEVVFNQDGGTTYYYADATDDAGYQAGLGDKRSADVVVDQYVPVADAVEAESDNGNAFDFDEYNADNDITVQVQDQRGADFTGGSVVEYYWVLTPFNGDDPIRYPAANLPNSTAPAGTDGEAVVPLPTNGEIAGTYTLFAGTQANPTTGEGEVAISEVLEVKAGQAAIEFDGTSTDGRYAAAAGSDVAVSGSLTLEDGTGLAGRRINLTYNGTDAEFDPATGDNSTDIVVVTGANGGFSATLDDPAVEGNEDQATETGTIAATTVPTPEAFASEDDLDESDDADESENVGVVFAQGEAADGTTVEIVGDITEGDDDEEGTDEDGDLGVAGTAQSGAVQVSDENGADVANQAVTLTVDGDSFFTSGDNADSTPEEDELAGDLENLGQTITLVTNGQGIAEFSVSIQRSEEFDEDGEAEDIVTATVAGADASDTEDVNWTTEGPLNGGDVVIEFASDRFQQSGVLPLAPLTDDVAYDVTVTDQFDNPVGGEVVDIDVNGGATVVDEDGNDDGTEDEPTLEQVVTDFDDNVEFTVAPRGAGDVTPTGTWNAPVTTVENGSEPREEIEGDGPTVTFYAVDFANSTFTLSQQGADRVPVGSTVIMTYTAVDQNGEPIELDDVDFLRAGPGNAQDDTSGATNPTGEDGKVNYVFQGASEGVANVTAIGYIDGEVVPESQASDSVTFGDAVVQPPVREKIRAKLSANNNGAKADRLQVTTGKAIAEGAVVKFFRIKSNGAEVQVGRAVLDANGMVKKNVRDTNGKKFSRYVAKVQQTIDTKFDRSNITRVR